MKNKIAFENLRAEMARKMVTISELAKAVGSNRVTLSQKLSRQHDITLTEAIRIEEKIGKPIHFLFAELYEKK